MFTWGSHTLSRLEFGVYQGKRIWPWHVPNLGELGFQGWSHSFLDQIVNFNSSWRCCNFKLLNKTFVFENNIYEELEAIIHLPKKKGIVLCTCQGQNSLTLANQIYFINDNFKCVWSNPLPQLGTPNVTTSCWIKCILMDMIIYQQL